MAKATKRAKTAARAKGAKRATKVAKGAKAITKAAKRSVDVKDLPAKDAVKSAGVRRIVNKRVLV